MNERHKTMKRRDHEIRALGSRLRDRAARLGVGEPDLDELAITCKGCGAVGCNEIQSMECPPTTKDY